MSVCVAIETHGCKLNQADSGALARRLAEVGCRLVGMRDRADIYILNTCTVTHVADSKARHALRMAHRRNPGAFIVAIGCYARRAPGELARIGGVDLVVDHLQMERVLKMVAAVERGGETVASSPGPPPARTRALVKIQEGCVQACAYCIVPRVRGRARSVPPDAVVGEVRRRTGEGYREVVLTGTQPGCYGADMEGVSLAGLVRRLLVETRVDRIRVSSLQPQEVHPGLVELWGDTRFCPHVHMSLQSGSAQVLRRMGRRYTPEEYMRAVEVLRSSVPGMAITTDALVGFPGETEVEFEESVVFFEEAAFSGVHVFPFSPRPGTRAARMDSQIPPPEVLIRMARMLSLSRELEGRYRRASLGQVRPVLWERTRRVNGGIAWSGLTDNYLRTFTSSSIDLMNRITRVQLKEEEEGAVWATVVGPVT